MKHCGNCANYVWGDKKTPLPNDCVTCTTTHVPNGEHPTPSHWKAKPITNADRIRAMSDEELAEWMAECNAYKENADASQWLPWLQQPAEDK